MTAAPPVPASIETVAEGARGLVVATLRWFAADAATASLALAIAGGLFVGMSALRRLAAPRQDARAPLDGYGLSAIARRVASHSKDWFLLAFSAQLTGAWFALPELLARGVQLAFTVAFTWQVAIWVRAIVLALVQRRADADGDSGQLSTALDIIRILVTALVFALAAIVVLDNVGANVTGLIAGLGIGGIAIGLAAQGVVGDLFAALSMIFDKPFVRGESINFDNVDGRVEAIGLKTTRIRALSGEEVVISNANLLGKVIRNYSRQAKRRISITIGLTYQTPPDRAAGLPKLLEELVGAHEQCRFVRAGLTGFGASSIDYVLVWDVLSEDYEVMITSRHAVIADIYRRFGELGLDFAYPTQLQLTGTPDGRIVDPRAPYPADNEAPLMDGGDQRIRARVGALLGGRR